MVGWDQKGGWESGLEFAPIVPEMSFFEGAPRETDRNLSLNKVDFKFF